MLVEEVRGKILPMRGIQAGADEVLVTLSSTHALQVAGELLVRRGTPVVLERPTEAAFERRLRERHADRSEEHTSELQSLMRISYAVFCLKKKKKYKHKKHLLRITQYKHITNKEIIQEKKLNTYNL